MTANQPTYNELAQALRDLARAAPGSSFSAALKTANQLAQRLPAIGSESAWLVSGVREDDGQIVTVEVAAKDDLHAFGAAAAKVQHSVQWVVATDATATHHAPGESAVFSSTVREQPEVFGEHGNLLPTGTLITSIHGEMNDLGDLGKVSTGPNAEGYIIDVDPSTENCYLAVFQGTGVSVYLSKDELADASSYKVGRELRPGEIVGFVDRRNGHPHLAQWVATLGLAADTGKTLSEYGPDKLSADEARRLQPHAPAPARRANPRP